jgi:hypothetical protein
MSILCGDGIIFLKLNLPDFCLTLFSTKNMSSWQNSSRSQKMNRNRIRKRPLLFTINRTQKLREYNKKRGKKYP